jgi:hypothetical protein
MGMEKTPAVTRSYLRQALTKIKELQQHVVVEKAMVRSARPVAAVGAFRSEAEELDVLHPV